MKFKRKVPAHVEERTETSRVMCDGCGRDVEHNRQGYDGQDEVTIGALIGAVYPEGDHRQIYELDVCGPCFVDKILPALKAAGFVVRARDIEGSDDGHRWDATHRCKVCGCLWRLNPPTEVQPQGSWSLADTTQKPGQCCDLVAMGDQIEPLYRESATARDVSGSMP